MTDLGSSSAATTTCERCGAQNERPQRLCRSCHLPLPDDASADGERGDLEVVEVERAFTAEGYEAPFAVADSGRALCPVCRREVAIREDALGDARETRDTPTARTGLLSLALRCPSCGALGHLTAAADDLAFDEGTSGEADARRSVAADTGATPERPLGEDRQHFVFVEDGDTRSLSERGPLIDEDGTDIREYTGEPVETEEGTVIPQQQNAGQGNEAGGGEWPDPNAPPAQ